MDWPRSTIIFRRPTVQVVVFVHVVPAATIKWIARIRSGCLNTRLRVHSHGRPEVSPTCPGCAAPEEDDEHALAGCPSTRTADWMATLLGAWQQAASAVSAVLLLTPRG